MREVAANPAGEARALARALAALEEGPMRARAAARRLAALPPPLAAEVVAELVRAGDGDRAPIAAVGRALAGGEGLDDDFVAALYAAAAARGLTEVQVLLVRPAARGGREQRAPDPEVESLSLGHRKSLARSVRDPDRLARLAADGDPEVVRELLRNPRLGEPLAVRIAARRPCRPETLRCLWEDPRWRVRPAVQAALAKNPHTDPAIALQLLPSLDGAALREIARDEALALAVRTLARRLRVLRSAGR